MEDTWSKVLILGLFHSNFHQFLSQPNYIHIDGRLKENLYILIRREFLDSAFLLFNVMVYGVLGERDMKKS